MKMCDTDNGTHGWNGGWCIRRENIFFGKAKQGTDEIGEMPGFLLAIL